jgi:hypothetical protein
MIKFAKFFEKTDVPHSDGYRESTFLTEHQITSQTQRALQADRMQVLLTTLAVA